MQRTFFDARRSIVFLSALLFFAFAVLSPAHAQWGWDDGGGDDWGGGGGWDSWDSGWDTGSSAYDIGDSLGDGYEVWDFADTSSDIGDIADIADIGSDAFDVADLGSDMFDISSSADDLGTFDLGTGDAFEFSDVLNASDAFNVEDALDIAEYADLGLPGDTGFDLPLPDADAGFPDISLEDIGDLVDYAQDARKAIDFFSGDEETQQPLAAIASEFPRISADSLALTEGMDLPELGFPLGEPSLIEDVLSTAKTLAADIASGEPPAILKDIYDACKGLAGGPKLDVPSKLPDITALPDLGLEDYYDAIAGGVEAAAGSSGVSIEPTPYEDLSPQQLSALTELLQDTLPPEVAIPDAQALNTSNNSSTFEDIMDAADTASDVLDVADAVSDVVDIADTTGDVLNTAGTVQDAVDVGGGWDDSWSDSWW